MQSESIRTVVEIACDRLDKLGYSAELVDSYVDALKTDWYDTCDDLRAGIADGESWTDVKLPNRLKLEIKKVICELDGKKTPAGTNIATVAHHSTIIKHPSA